LLESKRANCRQQHQYQANIFYCLFYLCPNSYPSLSSFLPFCLLLSFSSSEIRSFVSSQVGGVNLDSTTELDAATSHILNKLDRNSDSKLSRGDISAYWNKIESLLTADETVDWVLHSVQLPEYVGKSKFFLFNFLPFFLPFFLDLLLARLCLLTLSLHNFLSFFLFFFLSIKSCCIRREYDYWL
jgi:hypothetical protein